MKFSLKIGGVDYTKFLEVPFQAKSLLDESLDMASIRLFYTDKEEEFEPFTLVEISIKDDTEKKFELFVASDSTEKVLSTGKINHTLVLVEETKEIERLILTKTTTNPLVKNFEELQEPAPYDYDGLVISEGNYNRIYVPDNYITPLRKQTEFVLSPMREFYEPLIAGEKNINFYAKDNKLEVINPVGDIVYASKGDWEGQKFIDISMVGEWRFKYTWARKSTYANTYIDCELIFRINFTPPTTEAINKTITYVVESLLSTCETIRKGDEPRITFNKEQAELYKDIICPEMSFPKQTLWEALRQIGGVIHAMPRVRDNVLYFDSYDKTEYSAIRNKKPISETGAFDIEQFCSTIESSVDNLISMDNSSQGAIEDYGGLFKTIRTEQTTFQIREDNCFIETSLPIGRILKVEVGYLPNGEGEYVGDITPYVFERSEYDALSSYDETYPTSKALALYYKLGERNIGGLSFKVEDAVSSVFRAPAIKNIIAHKKGQDLTWWDNLFSTFKIFNLQFRVTYQPYYSATLRQVKPNLKDLKFKSVLSYTQGANSISTSAYGEHLKGAVARLGTAEKRKVYILKNLKDIPNVGDKFDKDYRISEVSCEFYRDYIICELGLSKKFNRWNNYVGVDNELRMYEVSTTQVSERPVIWEDYAVIQKTTENRFVEKVDYSLVDSIDNSPILNGIYNGYEFIVGGEWSNGMWYGNGKEWERIYNPDATIATKFVNGQDYLGRPLTVGVNEFWDRYANLYYWTDETNRNIAEIDFGQRRQPTGMAFGNGQFVLLCRGLEYVGDPNTDTIVLIGTPSQENSSVVTWEQDATTFNGYTHNWRLARIEGVFVAVCGNGVTAYHRDGATTQEGGWFWYQDNCPVLEDIIDAKSFDDKYVWAFNNSKLLRGHFEENELIWNEYDLPANNIVDFAIDGDTYVAITPSDLFYSLDLKTWVKCNSNISDMKHIVVGNRFLITNNSENVYSLALTGSQTMLTKAGVSALGKTYSNGIQSKPITIVNAKTYDNQDFLMYDYWLPVIVNAVGNTVQVQFEYVDNFSAGSYANTDENGTKTQTYAQYGDIFGEAKYLSVDFFDENPFVYEQNFDTFIEVGDDLPVVSLERESTEAVLSSTCNLTRGNPNHILLNKDSREKIKFSYCLHYVANDDDIVVGSGLAQINAFALRYEGDAEGINKFARVYILDREIGDFELSVDLKGATLQEASIECIADEQFGKLRFRKKENDTMLADGKAWVIVINNPYDKDEDLLLFGKNMEFKAGDLAEEVWGNYEIAFTHNVEEFL